MLIRLLILISFAVFASSCSLLNSGTATIKYSETRATFNKRDYRNKENLGDLSVSVKNLQHPKAHDKYDLNLRFSPSIHLDKTELVTSEKRLLPSGIYTDYPEITIRRLSVFINLKLTGHTPMGQFVATAGQGLAGFHARDGQGLDTRRTRNITKFELVYVGFFSKRFFFLTGPRYYNDGNHQYVWAARLGLFWGRINK